MGFPRMCPPCSAFAMIITIILILHPFHLSSSKPPINNGAAFTVEIIRRRFSPKLPPFRRLITESSSSSSSVHAYLGHYLMKLSLGTPPVDIYGIADTGSDLVWTQCLPCDNCYNQTNPMFDPLNSSTYTPISCTSDQCHVLDFTARACSPPNDPCNYTYAYASSAVTQGVLASETLTFTSQDEAVNVSLDGVVFGCGHKDTGGFNDHEMGIIGLGGGPLSLISQLGSSFGMRRFFSQCLVPFHTDVSISSRMSFGGDGSTEVSGDDVVSTPLIAKQGETYYYVTLQGISVGDTYLPFNLNTTSKGNMFIDSGTPPTILPQDLYNRVVEEVRKQVISVGAIEDDPELGSQLCYRTERNLDGPNLTAHFEGGDVELGPTQMFIPPKDGVFCLGLTNTSGDVGVYGNFAQSNYFIGFDLEKQVVSFKPTDCTKQ